MFVGILSWLWDIIRSVGGLFSEIPGRLLVVVTAFCAILAEGVAFSGQLAGYIAQRCADAQVSISALSSVFSASQVYMLFSYCLALDVLFSSVLNILGVILSIITFLVVTVLHVVMAFFGIRYGYRVYKYMIKVVSRGFSRS